MTRLSQAVAFFAVLGAVVASQAPFGSGAALFGVLLSGSVIAVAVVYVVPWVYFALDEEPASGADDA